MSIRPYIGFLHRWVGLLIAGFLFVSGITGAVISWDHELDDLLNPRLLHVTRQGAPLDPLALAQKVEADDPRVMVTSVTLTPEPGDSLAIGVSGRVDPKTGRKIQPGYNQLFLDPATGEALGRRDWGAAWPVTRENLVSFLYVLHYSLHVPPFLGTDRWGVWLMGGVALLWTIDCFFGFYLTLPRRGGGGGRAFWSRWKPAWKIKANASAYRLNFDLHRAFGLWLWGVLFTVAFTAFSLNLYSEVFYPALSKVSQTTPGPFELRTPRGDDDPVMPKVGYRAIVAEARSEAARRGWTTPAGGVFYSPAYGVYGVGFYEPGGDHGSAGVGPPYLYYDGVTGQLCGDRRPWRGTAADVFVQAQFPLHSGRILGLPGRILISFTGLAVAALSVTGVIIWLRKRRARAGRRTAAAGARAIAECLAE